MPTSVLDIVPSIGRAAHRVATRPAPRVQSRPRAHTGVRRHVLDEGVYREALVRERKRADRFQEPFVVLLVDRRDTSPHRGWAPILRAVAAVKRDADVVGWLEQDAVLGVLLRGAVGTGAVKVMDRLIRELALNTSLPFVPIRLYTYGDTPQHEDAELPAVDLLIDRFVGRRDHPWCDAAKRGLDVVGSLLLLALFAPVLLAIFFAVKWTSPGPAFFRQERIGRNGQPFSMLKFRTMYVNAGHRIHEDYVTWFINSSGQQRRTGDELFKLTDDPRITPAGRFLRKTSLDELPQFWNVLRGEMSLVGPRPPLPFEVEQYKPWHRRRVLEATPGVTGPWQVNGRSRTTFDEMVRLDLRYARTRSLWMDIKILAATPRAMVSGKGAC